MCFPVYCTITKRRHEQQHMVHSWGRNQQGNGSRSCRTGRNWNGEKHRTHSTLVCHRGHRARPRSHDTTPWSSLLGSPRISPIHTAAPRDLGVPLADPALLPAQNCCWLAPRPPALSIYGIRLHDAHESICPGHRRSDAAACRLTQMQDLNQLTRSKCIISIINIIILLYKFDQT